MKEKSHRLSRDAERSFDKILHPLLTFCLNPLCKVEPEENLPEADEVYLQQNTLRTWYSVLED